MAQHILVLHTAGHGIERRQHKCGDGLVLDRLGACKVSGNAVAREDRLERRAVARGIRIGDVDVAPARAAAPHERKRSVRAREALSPDAARAGDAKRILLAGKNLRAGGEELLLRMAQRG